jgi:putative MATE family efflux protein
MLKSHLTVDILMTATMGLAGMSINGALFNIIAAATAPIGTGTTAVISRIRGLGEKTDKKDRAGSSNLVDNSNNHATLGSGSGSSVGEVFLSGIFLAAGGGAILTALCILFGNSFVREVFQIKDGLLAVTVKYLKIRGLSLPSVLLNYIVFGFSIAMQDSVAPVLSIVTAFLVNVLGDYVLVGRLGYGLSGAAVATTVSSYLGSMVALRHLFKRYDIRIPRNVRSSAAGAGAANISGPIAWGKILNRRGLAMFFTASGPLLAGAMVNTLTYSAGARISSFTVNPALSTIEVAAHQVVMQSWWFLSYFSSPLSLVAQAVIPKDLVKGDSRRAQRMVVLLLQLAGVVAAVVTVLNVLLITRFPGIFTKNSEIQQIVRRVLVPSSISLFVICMTTAADGIFIGCGRVRDFLNASVISTTAAWVCFAYSIWNRMGLSGAWNGLLTFSVFRLLYYLVTFKSLWSSVSKHRPQTSDRDR